MATSSSLLSEEKFLCSVCLEVFTEPVSTPCGHNFCSGCINKFWDCTDICQCPLCNRPFSTRPELHINTIMSELAAEFKKSVQVQASIPDSDVPETADVPCDICFEVKDKAVKSCLVCLASFCKTHLEPHERVAGLQGHTLINPVKKLEDKMCKMHNKLTELYCRTDQVCICVLCIKATHKSHNVVPLEEEYESVMARKDDAVGDIQKMIQSRSEKIAEIEKGLDDSEKEAAKEKEATVQVFTDFIQLVQRGQSELVEVIEERYSATKKKGKRFLKELRMEVEELDSRSSQLQKLSLSEDHHHFLQTFPALSCPLNTDWTDAAVNSDLCFETVREAVTLLQEKVDEITAKVPEIKMRRMREHAVDLTFDPDTAHSLLVISHDGKQVTRVNEEQNLPGNSKRSEYFSEVLAKEGFTSGKFYYEVQVTGRDNWHVGARESRERNSSAITVRNGFWVIGTSKDGIFRAYTTPVTKITKIDNIQKVGVYVDYDKRVISFYNVESKSHMYSFTGCSFTKRLFPCFYLNDVEENAPIIITPVPKND